MQPHGIFNLLQNLPNQRMELPLSPYIQGKLRARYDAIAAAQAALTTAQTALTDDFKLVAATLGFENVNIGYNPATGVMTIGGDTPPIAPSPEEPAHAPEPMPDDGPPEVPLTMLRPRPNRANRRAAGRG